jgi:hypothetical protein
MERSFGHWATIELCKFGELEPIACCARPGIQQRQKTYIFSDILN